MSLTNLLERAGLTVVWQMTLGSIALVQQLIWASLGHEPQWAILSAGLALVGGGTVTAVGRGGRANGNTSAGGAATPA